MKSTAVIIVMGKRIRSLLWLQIHALVKCCFVRLWSTQCEGVGRSKGVVRFGPIAECCVLKWVCRVFWLFMWFAAGRGSRISLGPRWGTPVEMRGFRSLPANPGVMMLCGNWESLCVLNRVTYSYLDRNGTNYEGNWWKQILSLRFSTDFWITQFLKILLLENTFCI